MYVTEVEPSADDVATHVTEAVLPALATLRTALTDAPWDKAAIQAALKATLGIHGLKMPQLAMAVRVIVCGRAQTPSLDAVLALFPRDIVLRRLGNLPGAGIPAYNRGLD